MAGCIRCAQTRSAVAEAARKTASGDLRQARIAAQVAAKGTARQAGVYLGRISRLGR